MDLGLSKPTARLLACLRHPTNYSGHASKLSGQFPQPSNIVTGEQLGGARILCLVNARYLL